MTSEEKLKVVLGKLNDQSLDFETRKRVLAVYVKNIVNDTIAYVRKEKYDYSKKD